ncbi:MAG: hypothetical protein FWD32_00580 [Firmicutes bacterium]|nr:hypothetical protein [Bacillota bacterium]
MIKDSLRKPIMVGAVVLLAIAAILLVLGAFIEDENMLLTWLGAGLLVITVIAHTVVILDKDDEVATPAAKVEETK